MIVFPARSTRVSLAQQHVLIGANLTPFFLGKFYSGDLCFAAGIVMSTE